MSTLNLLGASAPAQEMTSARVLEPTSRRVRFASRAQMPRGWRIFAARRRGVSGKRISTRTRTLPARPPEPMEVRFNFERTLTRVESTAKRTTVVCAGGTRSTRPTLRCRRRPSWHDSENGKPTATFNQSSSTGSNLKGDVLGGSAPELLDEQRLPKVAGFQRFTGLSGVSHRNTLSTETPHRRRPRRARPRRRLRGAAPSKPPSGSAVEPRWRCDRRLCKSR